MMHDCTRVARSRILDCLFALRPPSLPPCQTFYGQFNEICSLKGSLNGMRFLETLDLSHNKLRDLDKLLLYLEKFHFLRTLNLKVNCCDTAPRRMMTFTDDAISRLVFPLSPISITIATIRCRCRCLSQVASAAFVPNH